MIANFKIKSMRYLMALAMVLISLSPISCKKEKGGSSELREIVITHPENGTMTITQGETQLIRYSTVPAEAEYEVALEWTSDDENVATVKNGRVKAHAPGTTTVHAKYESVSASVKVTVTAVPVTSFTVPSSMSAYLDMPTPVRLTVQPENANAASLQWDTDNPDIAYVEVNQGVAYIKAAKEGSCTISAYAENISTTRKIKVTVYPAIFKLMRRSISDESGYVEILNDDSFDITDVGMPTYEGMRYIEMIRLDGGELLDSSVEVNNENPGIVSITKHKRSESKIILNAEEKSEVGAAKISVSLKEDDNVYTKTFTITRQKHDFTSDTKICRIYTETPVNDVEEMAREAILAVQMFPAVNAVWTSSNESVAKVVPLTIDGKGFSPMAEIQTFGEYGSAEITATDESGKNTRKFTVNVSKASFPAGTKICIRTKSLTLEPVGESTTIRASYDGRNDEAFGLMDASGNYLSTFTNFKWTIESPSCECSLSPVGASGVIVAPISTTTFSGSKMATLVCTDDAGNRLTHKIIIASPNAFRGVQNLRVTVNGKSYTNDAKVDIGKTATIDITKTSYDSFFDGLKWENVGVLGGVYGTTKLNNNSSGSLMSIEFTPNRKMEAMPISVEDEIGQVKKIYISSAKFHFPDGAKLYYSYTELNPTNSGWKEATSGVLLRPNISTNIKIATSETGAPVVDKAYYYQVWASAIEKSKNNQYVNEFSPLYNEDYNVFSVFVKGYPPRDDAPEPYGITVKDDYGTSLYNQFYIHELVKFDSSTEFFVWASSGGAGRGYSVKYDKGKDKRLYVDVDPPSSGQIPYVRITWTLSYNAGYYVFPEARITNSVGEQSEYSMYHVRQVKFNPVSSTASSPTKVVLFDDCGNTKTIYISYNIKN